MFESTYCSVHGCHLPIRWAINRRCMMCELMLNVEEAYENERDKLRDLPSVPWRIQAVNSCLIIIIKKMWVECNKRTWETVFFLYSSNFQLNHAVGANLLWICLAKWPITLFNYYYILMGRLILALLYVHVYCQIEKWMDVLLLQIFFLLWLNVVVTRACNCI
jgi:hypothetical protein